MTILITFHGENPAQMKAEMLDFIGVKLQPKTETTPAATETAAAAPEQQAAEPTAAGKKRGRPAAAAKPAETPTPTPTTTVAAPEQPTGPVFIVDQGDTKAQCPLDDVEQTLIETIEAINTPADLAVFVKANNDTMAAVAKVDEGKAQRVLDVYKAHKAKLATPTATTSSDAVPTDDEVIQACTDYSAALGVPAFMAKLAEFGAKKRSDVPVDKRADFIASCKAEVAAKKALA